MPLWLLWRSLRALVPSRARWLGPIPQTAMPVLPLRVLSSDVIASIAAEMPGPRSQCEELMETEPNRPGDTAEEEMETGGPEALGSRPCELGEGDMVSSCPPGPSLGASQDAGSVQWPVTPPLCSKGHGPQGQL